MRRWWTTVAVTLAVFAVWAPIYMVTVGVVHPLASTFALLLAPSMYVGTILVVRNFDYDRFAPGGGEQRNTDVP